MPRATPTEPAFTRDERFAETARQLADDDFVRRPAETNVGLAAKEKPAAVEEKPAAVEQKSAARQSESVAPEDRKPANKPVETLQKRVEHEPHQRAMRSDNCKSYRTYDSASGTYRGYDGRRRVCR